MAERRGGVATVVAARSAGRNAQAGDGESHWWQDLGSAVFGKTAWELVLEVRSPSEPPYRVGVRTKLPHQLLGVRGFLDGATGIAPGLELPVIIDVENPADVRVDWRRFEQQAGARKKTRAADDADRGAGGGAG